jgi:hypothetical protein
MPFGGVPLRHLLNLNLVARSGARGVRPSQGVEPMTRRFNQTTALLLSGILALSYLQSCQKPKEDTEVESIKKSLTDLQARMTELEKNQQRLEKNQGSNQKDLMNVLQDMKPCLVQLKTLQEYEKEKELIETPVEKTRRAVREVRSLSTAVLSFATDANLYPEESPQAPYKLGELHLCRVVDIQKDIVPNYTRMMPGWDPWGNPYLYWASSQRDHFLILSMGQDGEIDHGAIVNDIINNIQKKGYVGPSNSMSCFESDIVWYDDSFIQIPQGSMKNCKEKK